MKNRPWPILIFGIIQILMPVFSVLTNAWLVHKTDVMHYLSFILANKSEVALFEYFALFPIAGIAILMMKKWSYPVFILVMGWVIGKNIHVWMTSYSGTQSSWIIIGFMLTNLFFVGYYLLPAIRQVYFNKRVRWWESKPRFLINLQGRMRINNTLNRVNVVDLSEGGAFLQTETPTSVGQILHLEFDFLGHTVDLPSKVVHLREGEHGGVGVQFYLNGGQQSALRNIISTLKDINVPVERQPDSVTESFRGWMDDLKRGRGFVPNTRRITKP